MKITKEVITNQTQQSKKSRGLKAAPSNLLGDVKLKKGNLKQDMVSFGSPVIYQEVIKHKSHPIFIKRLAKFIDKFEEKTKKNKQASVDSNFMSSEYLGHGMSGNAHILYDALLAVDTNAFDYIGDPIFVASKHFALAINDLHTKFVIKETQKSHSKDLEHEFKELKEVVDMPNMQLGVALMKTRDRGTFLISEFAKGSRKGIDKKVAKKK